VHSSPNQLPAPRPGNAGPRILGPNGIQLPDICQNCKFWIIRADDPQAITRCSGDTPKMITHQVPRMVKDPDTGEEKIVGMQLQIMSDFPPAPPWWSCGKFHRKLLVAQ
jgi:hypothetical protein